MDDLFMHSVWLFLATVWTVFNNCIFCHLQSKSTLQTKRGNNVLTAGFGWWLQLFQLWSEFTYVWQACCFFFALAQFMWQAYTCMPFVLNTSLYDYVDAKSILFQWANFLLLIPFVITFLRKRIFFKAGAFKLYLFVMSWQSLV